MGARAWQILFVPYRIKSLTRRFSSRMVQKSIARRSSWNCISLPSPARSLPGSRLYEAGAPAEFIQVDTRTKRLADGSDFRAINAMGQVPVLRTDDGELLTENPAVLQYVADQYPESGLAPASGMARYRLQQWLNFITSELHKVVFIPLLDPTQQRRRQELRARQGDGTVRLSECATRGARVPAGPVHRRRCVSRHSAQLGTLLRCGPRAIHGGRCLFQPPVANDRVSPGRWPRSSHSTRNSRRAVQPDARMEEYDHGNRTSRHAVPPVAPTCERSAGWRRSSTDRDLWDVGLTRGDLYRELAHPFWRADGARDSVRSDAIGAMTCSQPMKAAATAAR